MRCLINHARRRAGVGRVRSQGELGRAAGQKAGDIKRCGFSHTACGRPSDYWPKHTGYTSGESWVVGENIAWGRGRRGSARHVMSRWLGSPSHREVLLMGRFEHSGLGLQTKGAIAFWALELGST